MNARKPIQEQLRDTALELMDELSWDIEGRVPALMWNAAAHIDRLEGKPALAEIERRSVQPKEPEKDQ